MNKKVILALLLFVVCLTATGCGSQVMTLSDDESAKIATYSAKIVSKYNKQQKDGLCAVDTSDIKKKSSKKETETEGEDVTATTKVDGDAVSLTQALNINGANFTYDGFAFMDQYQNSVACLTPSKSSNKFLCVKFKLTNALANDVSVDVLTLKPTFTITCDDGTSAKSQTTILTEDLSTYQGVVSVGASKDLVLLFEVPAKSTTNIKTISLQMTQSGTSYQISL